MNHGSEPILQESQPDLSDASPSILEKKPNTSDRIKRVVVILSDGRVDSFQSREAINSAKRMADQLPNLSLHALGVGRGVDSQEMKRLITAGMRSRLFVCYFYMFAGKNAEIGESFAINRG